MLTGTPDTTNVRAIGTTTDPRFLPCAKRVTAAPVVPVRKRGLPMLLRNGAESGAVCDSGAGLRADRRSGPGAVAGERLVASSVEQDALPGKVDPHQSAAGILVPRQTEVE